MNTDPSKTISDRHNYLMDMLHSLGASHLGFAFGFATYLLVKWRLGQAELWWSLVAVGITLVTIIFLSTEDTRNKRELKILNMTVKYPAELFLASLFFLFLTLNPALGVLLPYELPTMLCIAFALLWGWSVKESREIVWGATLVLALITLSALAKSLSTLNWPVILSILIFSCVSLAFLKNRQNARENLVVLEYYSLRNYLDMVENRTSASPNPTTQNP